ncbi:beta-ketoacyl synthase chain length factor [Sulfurospirillum multivorans]|uniref:Beta-ketoacyl synthase domain-containing protein n=2 Tax=Sulfurospirillum multivorans TaxID=66821 RepID=A0AA86AR09_SULMK|nr:beta-ketoacyl synthase chain length factor [Sulfurospirillum multivorans]AHJ14171.1 beta-ketoacyl synthase domain-containing protein [Sulfurospirillum multivorans DSM 12446]QEH07656.1 beta-ketoacyl synthase domain-containing protein [Sulfurospirillum multivorans]
MKVNLEILSSAYLLGEKSLELPRIKELVPQMMVRRRLTKAAKICVELLSRVEHFKGGRILCGSAFGELETTANILNAIHDEQPLSPTDFQNSVYNTAVSYLSILYHNHNEILTLSCGDKTARSVLKAGALKALDGDILLLLCFETLDIPNIEQVNHCIDYLESGVALVVRVTEEEATLSLQKSELAGVPNSISEMLHVAQNAPTLEHAIVEVNL